MSSWNGSAHSLETIASSFSEEGKKPTTLKILLLFPCFAPKPMALCFGHFLGIRPHLKWEHSHMNFGMFFGVSVNPLGRTLFRNGRISIFLWNFHKMFVFSSIVHQMLLTLKMENKLWESFCVFNFWQKTLNFSFSTLFFFKIPIWLVSAPPFFFIRSGNGHFLRNWIRFPANAPPPQLLQSGGGGQVDQQAASPIPAKKSKSADKKAEWSKKVAEIFKSKIKQSLRCNWVKALWPDPLECKLHFAPALVIS